MTLRGDRSVPFIAEELAGLRKELRRITEERDILKKAELLIFDYIESYYNRKRRHSALG